MIKGITILSSSLLFILLSAPTCFASNWESLFRASTSNGQARVELKSDSFLKRQVRGEKIINAHLYLFYEVDGNTVSATGDYEIYCRADKVFRSNLDMTIEDPSRTQTNQIVPKRVSLTGKEYQDFSGIKHILCSR